MRFSVLLFFLISTAAAEPAEPVNMKLRLKPSSGEMVATDKPCGKTTQKELWGRMFESPWLEIVDDVMKGASASYKGNPFIAHWKFADRVYVISVLLPKTRKQRLVVTSFLITYETPVGQCYEKWLGLSERW